MKNILVLVGSAHRKGNTEKLADAFIEGAVAAGHHVTKVSLAEKGIHGCLGCNACRSGRDCIQKDGMTDIYPLYEQCDMVVLASPLYYWTISSQVKAFIERLYATSTQEPAPGKGRYEHYAPKECALLMTAADDLFWTFEQAVSYYRFCLINYLGWTDRGMVLAGGCGGVSEKRHLPQEHLDAARALGESL